MMQYYEVISFRILHIEMSTYSWFPLALHLLLIRESQYHDDDE